MKIHLYDDLYITSDTNNVMLSKQRLNKKTKEYEYVPQSFYPTVEAALVGLHRQKMRESDAESFTQLVEESRSFYSFLKDKLGC